MDWTAVGQAVQSPHKLSSTAPNRLSSSVQCKDVLLTERTCGLVEKLRTSCRRWRSDAVLFDITAGCSVWVGGSHVGDTAR